MPALMRYHDRDPHAHTYPRQYKERGHPGSVTVHWNEETYIVDFTTMTQLSAGTQVKPIPVRCLQVVLP
jgi:hypothetical protein